MKNSWVVHLFVRIIMLPLLFILIYQMIRGNKSDPMGFGLVYTFITITIISVFYFGVEAIILYRQRKWTKFYCDIFLLTIATICLLIITTVL